MTLVATRVHAAVMVPVALLGCAAMLTGCRAHPTQAGCIRDRIVAQPATAADPASLVLRATFTTKSGVPQPGKKLDFDILLPDGTTATSIYGQTTDASGTAVARLSPIQLEGTEPLGRIKRADRYEVGWSPDLAEQSIVHRLCDAGANAAITYTH